ncbi:MAG TPA: hypothetical protein VGG64_06650 [Pirellulales bacterium]|jgi:hypothetical protein
MSWSYDPKTRLTDATTHVLPRTKVEDAIALLVEAGIWNQYEITRIVKALSGLGRGEVRFNVNLVLNGKEQ